MSTDHDKIVTVEGTVGTLSRDVEVLKDDVEQLKTFRAKVEAMASLGKWQFAVTLGNGCLLVAVLYLNR